MKDFKLKLLLSLLVGIVFSFVFILLAFAAPIHKKEDFLNPPKGKLEEVARSVRKK